jgi:hypothetical protein
MDKRDKQMKIDAEKFAYTVISSHHVEGDALEEIAKKQLTLYLTAYGLAERFNKLETQSFDTINKKDYEDLMLKLSGFRPFQ